MNFAGYAPKPPLMRQEGGAEPPGLFPYPIAAPSWVTPGSIVENCRFLAGRVREVGLLFMESESSLAYGRDDLPLELRDLPLSWHVHLPVDLRWESGRKEAEICLKLMDKLEFLDVRRAVLHPPVLRDADEALRLLEEFTGAWLGGGREARDILLENINGASLVPWERFIVGWDCSLCPDLGHILSYGHEDLLRRPELLCRARMAHLNAPKPGKPSWHGPLSLLGGTAELTARKFFRALPPDCVHMLELFTWRDIEDSMPVLRNWL